jgi:hypothetical protein
MRLAIRTHRTRRPKVLCRDRGIDGYGGVKAGAL